MGVKVAKQTNSIILSLDSLAIYKEINVASAKPCMNEREGVVHFGVDEIYPNEAFNVTTYISLYKKAKDFAKTNNKNLIILGGTSFYLDVLLRGVSKMPFIPDEVIKKADEILKDTQAAYATYLQHVKEPTIAKNDRYRLQKWFEFYLCEGITKEEYFKKNPPVPVINEKVPVYEIAVDKEVLKKRIDIRTKQMFDAGIVSEVKNLILKYGKEPKAFKAIGIIEVIEYLEKKHSLNETIELVATHTKQLAKRQRTFNRSKFPQKISLPLAKMEQVLIQALNYDS